MNLIQIEEWKKLNKTIVSCNKCARLVAWREQVAREKRKSFVDWEYWGKPVPGFGDFHARVLIVGLAPGAHGSNRTGRMFTGDGSGDFLFQALYKNKFSNQVKSSNQNDGLILKDIYITAVCRCVPPFNHPENGEIQNCLHFLFSEKNLLNSLQGIVALGNIAYSNVTKLFHPGSSWRSAPKFSHGVFVPSEMGNPWILGSYHPSRQNTQTGRLTFEMFDLIWKKASNLLLSG